MPHCGIQDARLAYPKSGYESRGAYAFDFMEKSGPRLRANRKKQEALLSLLRRIRIEAGMRQEDLADKLGMPQSVVSKFESGERRLDLLELRDVCVALGISLEDFVRRFEELLSKPRPR
jgi:ribosome-binding protein aMBF1 (putative translation factor)